MKTSIKLNRVQTGQRADDRPGTDIPLPSPISCRFRLSASVVPKYIKRLADYDQRGCGRGEIGRRAGLKIRFRKECRFESARPHQGRICLAVERLVYTEDAGGSIPSSGTL